MSRSSHSQRDTFWGLVVFTTLGAVLTVMFFLQANENAGREIAESRAAAIKAVRKNARLVTEKISGLTLADDLADELTRGDLTYADIDARLKEELRSTDGISVTVALLPAAATDSGGSVDDHVIDFKFGINSNEGLNIQQGHYTRPEVEKRDHGDISVWYEQALEAKQGVWFSSPYMSPFSKRWWACGYSVPYFVDGRVAGVVAVEFTAPQLNQMIFEVEKESFKVLPANVRFSSYSMLISENGAVFSHPDVTVVEEQKKLSDFFCDLDDLERDDLERDDLEWDDCRLDDQGLNDPSGFGKLPREFPVNSDGSPDLTAEIYAKEGLKDSRSGKVVSVFLAPVEGTEWWTAVVLGQKAAGIGINKLRWIKSDAMKVAMSVLAFVFGLVLLGCRVDRGIHGRLWSAAILTTLICMAGIAWVLSYSMNYGGIYNFEEVVLNNRAMPSKVIMAYRDAVDSEPISVPTGIFVQSAEFSSANNVTITGFVWQTYDDSMPDWLQRDENDQEPGFIFPESEQTDVEFRYRRPAADGWTYGWYFSAVLRQEFDYRKYPFDLENVWIRMWHNEVGKNVILVPDLHSYYTLVPEWRPGLEFQDFVLEGWNVSDTYFSYRKNIYNTNFGIEGYTGNQKFPELYFNIELTRSFLNAFIMNFIALSVAAVLLYAVLFTIRTRKKKLGLLGFNVSGVLGFCAALFFVVILAHTSLRQSLASPTLVYLEYYYFVMYAAFLGVSINAIVVASDLPHRVIRVGDNLVARLLFWPLLSFALLLATLMIFR